jgi:histidyl-tRNA synthetase
MISVAQQLRGADISCEFPLKKSGVGKLLKQANAVNAKISVFLGGSEALEGNCKIRQMSSGKETVIPHKDLLTCIDALLDIH